MSNFQCDDCGTIFKESDAELATRMADDMYDRGPSPFLVLACPVCLGTELYDTEEEPTR